MLGFAVTYGLWPMAQPGLSSLPMGLGCGANMTGLWIWSQAAEPAAGHRLRLGPQTHVKCWFASSQIKAEKACGDASSTLRHDKQSASLLWLLYNVPETAPAAESGFTLGASYIWRQEACGSCAGAGPGLSPSSRSWIPGSTRDGRSGAMKEP